VNYLIHCKNSAKRHGGKMEDYIPIHCWLDQTKNYLADLRHRVILHNSFGVGLCVQMFGDTITNSDGDKVSVRLIAEEHILEDMGCIPTLEEVLRETPITDIQAPRLRFVVGAYKDVKKKGVTKDVGE